MIVLVALIAAFFMVFPHLEAQASEQYDKINVISRLPANGEAFGPYRDFFFLIICVVIPLWWYRKEIIRMPTIASKLWRGQYSTIRTILGFCLLGGLCVIPALLKVFALLTGFLHSRYIVIFFLFGMLAYWFVCLVAVWRRANTLVDEYYYLYPRVDALLLLRAGIMKSFAVMWILASIDMQILKPFRVTFRELIPYVAGYIL